MQKPRFFMTDVFTPKRYGGNPLATFVVCNSLSDAEMQHIAKEINFSETTFISSLQPVNGGYNVRIFTPKAEIDFAGHPCLGTAYVLSQHLMMHRPQKIVLNLRQSQVSVRIETVVQQAPRLWLQQAQPEFGPSLSAQQLAPVLGLDLADLDPAWPIQQVSTGFPHILVAVNNLAALRRIQIQKSAYFSLVNESWAKVILAFSPEAYNTDQDFAVRVFADYYGISEDAATGSGNGCLAAYLLQQNTQASASLALRIGQGYELNRPAELLLQASKSPAGFDLQVGGQVVDVAAGVWG